MKRDDIKKAIREEWEAGGISFKALAEKHGVPEGTLKSWAKREGWQKCIRNPDATGARKIATADATVGEKVATESKDASEFSRYNWEELKREFITGEYSSLNDFARQHGFAGNNGFFARASKGWIHEKKHYEQKKSRELTEETLRKTAEKASEEFSDFAVQIAKTLLEIFEENQAIERNLIAKLYQKTDQLIDQLDLELVLIKSRKRKKMKVQIVKGNEMTNSTNKTIPGDMELTYEEEEVDLGFIPGLVNGKKYEAAVKGLERIQQMNRIAFGIDRAERREDLLLRKQVNKAVQIGEGETNDDELIVRFVDGIE